MNKSKMRRLWSDPIQGLRRILRDNYEVTSILKEILQNADDAKASELHLAVVHSWPSAPHPLLSGPALLVLNDGGFEPSDIEGIERVDQGAKGADDFTIGKYGLGMKSLFHLCEGLFYAASPNQPGTEGTPLVHLLNPWPQGGPRDEWGALGGATEEILRTIERWEHGCRRWFCLVVPLRRPQHMPDGSSIMPDQPKVEDVEQHFRLPELVGFLPLLRSIRTIGVWEEEEDRSLHEVCRASPTGEIRQRAYGSSEHTLPVGQPHRLRFAAVQEGETSKTPLLHAAGIEKILGDAEFEEIKRDPHWPIANTWDVETRTTREVREKASPHCAAVFAKHLQDDPQLTILDAVYLPLSKGSLGTSRLNGAGGVRLVLHGQYFLDAGRNQLYRSPTESTPQDRWNEALRTKGVLPLIPQALDEYRTSTELGFEEVSELTRVLGATEFFEEQRTSVCRTHQWLPVISLEDPEASWQLVDTAMPFVPFPVLKGRDDIVRALIPLFNELTAETLLVEDPLPRLSATASVGWDDHQDLADALVEALSISELRSAGSLQFLTELLGVVGDALPQRARQSLAGKLSGWVAGMGVPALRKLSSEVDALVCALPDGLWVALELSARQDAVYRDLNRLGLGVVVLPSELTPSTSRSLSLKDAIKAFDWLAENADTASVERTGALALALIDVTVGTAIQQREALGAYPVWLLRALGTDGNHEVLATWNKVVEHHEQDRLFEANSPFIKPLQRALSDATVLSLFAPAGREPFKALLGLDEPPRCDGRACIRILVSQPTPKLSPVEERLPLLQRLRDSFGGHTDGRQAVRYLLHGHAQAASDATTSLIAGGSTDSAHLSWAAERALLHLEADWRWVQSDLADALNPRERERLGISHVSPATLESLLTESGVEWMRSEAPPIDYALRLLEEIRPPELWRAIPLHRLRSGSETSLPHDVDELHRVFLDTGFIAPSRIELIAQVIQDRGSKLLGDRYLAAGIRAWDEESAITVALSGEGPSQHATDILDLLAAHEDAPSRSLLRLMRERPWLPVAGLPSVSPRDMIIIDGLESVVDQLLKEPKVRGAYAGLNHLDRDVRTHGAIRKLRALKILPDKNTSLDVLALCLGELDHYKVGVTLRDASPTDFLQLARNAFVGIDQTVLPAVPLVNHLWGAFSDRRPEMSATIAPVIAGPLPRNVVPPCVRTLTEHVATDQGPAQRPRLEFLGQLLRELFEDGREDELSGLELPNALAQPAPVTALCAAQEGIAPSHRLHDTMASLVPVRRTDEPAPDVPNLTEESDAVEEPGLLIDYLRNWDGQVPAAQRGALLALFGSEEEIEAEANRLLPPRSVDGVRESLEWSETLADRGRPPETIQEAMAKQRFVFRSADDGESKAVTNLLGAWFHAPVGGVAESIFVGSLWPTPPARYQREDVRVKLVTLREIEIDDIPRSKLSEILRRSTRLLLEQVYRQEPGNFATWWEELAQGGQLALEIAQAQIVRDSWFYFQQLGEAQLPTLRGLIRRHVELSDREIELARSNTANARSAREVTLQELSHLPDALRALLEGDEQVQAETLASVRRKMDSYQYSARSVPFELFQNADDALSEWIELQGTETNRPDIVVEFSDQGLTLTHWGRPINQFGGEDKGRALGYDKDLKRMLVLATSDKSERDRFVTGKFGLGFKSVYFLTDEPQVVSGDLAFRVLGGFYPAELDPEQMQVIREQQGRFGTATTIFLPFIEGAHSNAAEALDVFEALVPIVMVTARALKRCTVVRGGDISVNAVDTEPLGTIGAAWLHRVGDGACNGPLKNATMLSLYADGSATLIMRVGQDGMQRFPPVVPDYWVRMPTGQSGSTGLVLQGPFEIDVGRSQLALERTSENNTVAERLGRAMGRSLVDLFDASHDWSSFGRSLGLSNETSRGDFWRSVWDLTSTTAVRASGGSLMRRALWSENAPMERLVRERPALPTGLGEGVPLTSLQEVTHQTVGILDRTSTHEGLIELAERAGKRPGSIVSGSRVATPLRELGVDLTGLLDLTLEEVLRGSTLENGLIEPAVAEDMGHAITSDDLWRWRLSGDLQGEVNSLLHFLRSLRFRTVSETPMASDQIVVPGVEGEEALVATFAPDEHILAGDYAAAGRSFVELCRGLSEVVVRHITEWAKQARTTEARVGVLRYLLDGHHRRALARSLAKSGTWLQADSESAFASLAPAEQREVESLLAGARADPAQPPRSLEPADGLEAIANWWQDSSRQLLPELERRVYPSGRAPSVSAEPPAPDDDAERAEWVKLFLLGSIQPIGWTSPERNRDFVDRCEQEGWLSSLARANREPRAWVDDLLDHVEAQEADMGYFQHLKSLFGVGLIARHLDEYIEAFLNTERISADYDLAEIASPRTSAHFQGGGPDAPPLGRILGVGQCFVLRELVRGGVLTNKHTYRHCYLSFERTRRLIQDLGGPDGTVNDPLWRFSSRIYGFLLEHLGPRATFDQSFDIPLTILAEQPELRREVLAV